MIFLVVQCSENKKIKNIQTQEKYFKNKKIKVDQTDVTIKEINLQLYKRGKWKEEKKMKKALALSKEEERNKGISKKQMKVKNNRHG